MITLGRGGFELDIDPELGGAVTRLDFEDRPVLRRGLTTQVLEASCFPLVPYANRIAFGVLKYEGKEHHLPLNFGDHPHSLHGQGWQNVWRVDSMSRDRVSLGFDYEGEAWPWPYASKMVFSMEEDGVRIALSLHNRSDKPMPYSLGLHPYFPRRPGSRLTAKVGGMWRADSTMIPTELAAATDLIDLGKGQVVSVAPFIDNTFSGWEGSAVITQPELGLEATLTANCSFFHVFIPEGADFFCAEPTTAMPNAFARPAEVSGARVVEPGQTVSMDMRLSVRKL